MKSSVKMEKKESAMIINRLHSGGLITNYHCTSRCAHCQYNCRPGRDKAYMTPGTARASLKIIRAMGCASVHIGGGEPMIDAEVLVPVLEAALRAGVGIDYVETNSSWYTDRESAVKTLSVLKAAGLHTLLVSISPFHNAAVPLAKIKGVMSACRGAGIRVFPWIADFLDDLSRFDETRTHTLDEYKALFGGDYLRRVLGRYWVHPGGRALETFRPVLPTLTAEQVRLEYARSCRAELSDTGHFHIDFYGNYVPGLCSGLAFAADQLGRPLDEERYPVLGVLWKTGIRGLLEWAGEGFGFVPRREAYVNKCDLCNDIRGFLVESGGRRFEELAPAGYYGG